MFAPGHPVLDTKDECNTNTCSENIVKLDVSNFNSTKHYIGGEVQLWLRSKKEH